jgi:hypothetical protein
LEDNIEVDLGEYFVKGDRWMEMVKIVASVGLWN